MEKLPENDILMEVCLHFGSVMRFGPSGFSLAWKETDICSRGDVTKYVYTHIYIFI